jgi:nucleotide-binding universal stress UspA family protein
MIRIVAVPLDGSRFAESALPVALGLAHAAGAAVQLIGVHEPQLPVVPLGDVPVLTGADDPELRAQQQEYLASTSRQSGLGNNRVDFELIDGIAGPALAQWIDERAPDLVVMSTHGRGPRSRFWLGSVADHVIRHV